MSEPKRVVPQCLEFPDSLGHATKKEKKREKGKQQLAPSFRFTIALPESNDKTYSEFNYAQLVKSAEKKRRKEESRVHDENATNGLDPFEDGDDDKLREMASRFEAKYGTATAGRKRHKHDDYVDLGAGYDENDSFIDNTDAYDEIVPREVTTAYGGFYINSGPLEFKPADENSPVHSRLNHNNNNNNNVEDEEEESSEESIDDEEEIGNRVLQRMEKRILSSSDEDDEEDLVSSDPPRKKHKSEENGEKKSSQSQENVMKRKRKVAGDSCNSSNNPSNQCEEVEAIMTGSTTTTMSVAAVTTTTTTTTTSGSSSSGAVGKSGSVADDKREILDVECSSEDQDEKKRTKYDTNKTKSTGGEKKYDVKKIDKKIDPKRPDKKHQPQPQQQPQQQQQQQPQQQQQQQQQQQAPSNGIDVKKIDLKKLIGKDSNIDDAIESVVNAGRAVDESSHDSIDSVKSHFLPGSESECDDLDKEDTPLPEHLADDVKDIINKLKSLADKNREGKNKIFDEHFNSILLMLEEKLRIMNSPITRLLTYGHLASFLRCNKANLVTRAKKLCLQDAERRMTVPFRRLKTIIESTMPGVVERYAKECQRVAEEKGLEVSPAEVDSSDAENFERSKIPRKKFPWTPETKKLIYELACARRHYFKMRKPRKESVETFIATYMESKVLPLWPGGWVRLQTLLKYSNPEPAEKRKQKKPRDGGTMVNNLSALSGQSNSVVRQESLGISMVPSSQEGGGMSGTNAAKMTNENNLNFSPTHLKSGETTQQQQQQQVDRKMSSKSREKNSASPVIQENPCVRGPGEMAKITVVPTSQLIGQNKGMKSVQEKFNPMDLTSSSLSITPVNDFSKSSKSCVLEMKKDVVSITPYSETTTTNVNDSVGGVKNGSTKRIQDGIENRSEKRIIEESSSESSRKSEKREKRREKWHEEKRCHDAKKRRKEQKSEQNVLPSLKTETSISQQQASSLTKEEQEQRQIEETMAATNFLSQIINDDLPSRVSSTEKRKEQQNIVVEENVSNLVVQQQASDQDNDVQMVMRSLKELQELQEMKYSPGHSPIGGQQQKSSKASHQYVPYQDDYPRIYNKKDEKMRVPKEETSSW